MFRRRQVASSAPCRRCSNWTTSPKSRDSCCCSLHPFSCEQLIETDASGYFVLCDLDVGGSVRLRAEAWGNEGDWEEVEVPRRAITIHEAGIRFGTDRSGVADIALRLWCWSTALLG